MVAMNGQCSNGTFDGLANAESIVAVDHVTRRFGAKLALDDVTFRVPAGSVVGLVGENGAGKTTLIKHILGLLKAQTGSVRVFGLDPVADPVGVLSRVGYLSEEPDMPGWMRVHELIRYVAAFYPTWDAEYAEQLRREFDLDPNAKVKQLSKGQRARAGLLIALAYRPELLLLDEPSSGLDPIVRRDILGAIIRTIADEGRTVLFSSHLLAEVERVSDQVAMIQPRPHFVLRLARSDQANARPAYAPVRSPATGPASAVGRTHLGRFGPRMDGRVHGPTRSSAIGRRGPRGPVVERADVSLDEIFIARSGASNDHANGD